MNKSTQNIVFGCPLCGKQLTSEEQFFGYCYHCDKITDPQIVKDIQRIRKLDEELIKRKYNFNVTLVFFIVVAILCALTFYYFDEIAEYFKEHEAVAVLIIYFLLIKVLADYSNKFEK